METITFTRSKNKYSTGVTFLTSKKRGEFICFAVTFDHKKQIVTYKEWVDFIDQCLAQKYIRKNFIVINTFTMAL